MQVGFSKLVDHCWVAFFAAAELQGHSVQQNRRSTVHQMMYLI